MSGVDVSLLYCLLGRFMQCAFLSTLTVEICHSSEAIVAECDCALCLTNIVSLMINDCEQ